MKKFHILLFLLSLSGELLSQKPSNIDYDISAWGSEPGWEFIFKGNNAAFNLFDNPDSSMNYMFVNRISNQGFTNEFVDTYLFESANGDLLTLLLVKNDECPCTYDMGEGESNINAFLQTNFNHEPWMLIGCAKIDKRP